MAYDKIIPIRRRLDHCVDYALNEEKTSPGLCGRPRQGPPARHRHQL